MKLDDSVAHFRFYFFINVGSFIAFSAVVYVQQEIGFTPGYIIPAGGMLLAIIIFVGAKRGYTHHPPGGEYKVLIGEYSDTSLE